MPDPAPHDARATHGAERWLPWALAGLVLAVFGATVAYPFVHWDDGLHVGDDPLTTVGLLAEGWRGLLLTPRLGYPVPVAQISFRLDYALFGGSPRGFHAENVALHLANAFLVSRLGRRLGLSTRGAYAAAALFAVHPLVAEPVSWVTGRKDLLATALLLASLVVASTPRARRTGLALAGATGLAVLAMLTKPSTLIAPVLFVLVLPVARPDLSRRAIAIPSGALAAAAAVAAWLGVVGEGGVGAVRERTAPEAAREIGGALAAQLAHVVWPLDLLPRYFREPGEPSVLVIALALGAVVALGVVAARARATSPVRLGLAFAGVAYLPVCGVVGINRWFADSYMYLPLVGLAIAAAGAASERWPARLERVGLALFGATLAVLAPLAFAQSRIWRSSSTLWPAVVARYPHVPRAWALQATGDLADGKAAEAEAIYVRLHDEFPAYDGAVVNQVYAYEAMGRPDVARDLWKRCLTLGKAQCVDVFWDRVLYASPRPPDDAELMAIAFDAGQAEMAKHYRDAPSWRAIAAALRRAGLEERAARAQERAPR